MSSFDKVYYLVSTIPKGKITTYGTISKIINLDPRVVGYALHANKDSKNIPCHRVINSKGKISSGYAFGGSDTQKEMLMNEGIIFDNENRVDLKRFGYLFSAF